MRYYTVYKITNLVNEKIYVGAHETDDLNDNYMGSGKLIQQAIEKHGLESFSKKILKTFTSSEEMYEYEAELVTEEFVARRDTYNLKSGGLGFSSEGATRSANMNSEKSSELMKKRWQDPEFRELQAAKTTEWLKKRWQDPQHRKKMLVTARTSTKGSKYIYNVKHQKVKRVKPEELDAYLQLGWKLGRKMKW